VGRSSTGKTVQRAAPTHSREGKGGKEERMIAVKSKRRKKAFTRQRAIWIAYVRPDYWAEFSEPEFKVVAPLRGKRRRS
jgi:hypothetical protein